MNNRTPPKPKQLTEAMQERSVTKLVKNHVGDLPILF
jgi:hypothetical protein